MSYIKSDATRRAAMGIRIVLGVLGVLYLLNGIWTVAEPSAWYATVPGVSATGPKNLHFIEDIGLAGVASGILLLAGAFRNAATLAVGGALWPAMHALIHIAGWFQHGLPADPGIIFTDVVGVVTLSMLGVVIAVMQMQRENRAI
jgi:hypothetical protein